MVRRGTSGRGGRGRYSFIAKVKADFCDVGKRSGVSYRVVMDRQPTLEGEHLLLRPLREADRAALYAAANDPALWADHPEPERWREVEFAAFFDGLIERSGALAVIDKASGALIGTSSYQYGAPDAGGTIEIGSTFLARAHWGGGTNREMKRLLIAHALDAVRTVEFWNFKCTVSSGNPCQWRFVISWPRIVPTTRFVFRIGSVAVTFSPRSMAGLQRSSSFVRSSEFSRP